MKGALRTMPKTPPFYSVNEEKKPAGNRVYHDNGACPPGRDIPFSERRSGTNNYRLCHDCGTLNSQGR
jgi:hypothetical protein